MSKRKVGIYEYDKKDRLGGGSFGDVYKGYSNDGTQIVAIKKASLKKFCSTQGLSSSNAKAINKYNELIEREVETMSLSCGHPNIVTLYYHEESIDKNDMRVDYIVTEYCPGSFSHLIESGDLTFDEIRFYFRQICCGILWLNHKNIVHRDLKPDNILYVINPKTDEKIIKIIDFGFSRTLYCDVQTMSRLGTMLYMAPEVYSRSGDHHKADLWSAGVILAQMIIPASIAFFDPFAFTRSDFPPDVPDGCYNLLKALLTKDPKKRISWDYLARDEWLSLSPEEIIPPHPPVSLLSTGSYGGTDEDSPTLGPAVKPDPFAELFHRYTAYFTAIVYAAATLDDREAQVDALAVYVFGASVGAAFYDITEASVIKLAEFKADERYKAIQDMVMECINSAADIAAMVGMDAEVSDPPEKVIFNFALGLAKEGLHYEGLYSTAKAMKLYEKSKDLLDVVVEFSKALGNEDRVIMKRYAETIDRRINLLNNNNGGSEHDL